jgi:hypothetical protein
VTLAEDENVMPTLAPDRTDQPLRKGVLPGAVRRREHLLDPHALYAVPKFLTVDLPRGRGGDRPGRSRPGRRPRAAGRSSVR